ncbi:hypothetical protein NIES2104_17300 [Leptolyngbya sp. NIES-2104]|nr:hypothetical protein NIES2104_17300 [Leptolyngbya sp. NIES-2104]
MLNDQPLSETSAQLEVASVIDVINQGTREADQIRRKIQAEERRRERQRKRELEAQKRRERAAERERLRREIEASRQQRRVELEAARKRSTEQQRLEAERRQQYFNSLSPQEQKAYLAQQQRRKREADQAALLFILGLAALSSQYGSMTQEGGKDAACNIDIRNDRNHPAYARCVREEQEWIGNVLGK